MTSKEQILNAVRANLPEGKVEHPGYFTAQKSAEPLLAIFKTKLVEAGGSWHSVGNTQEANALIATLYPTAKVLCSATPEIAGTRKLHEGASPADLNDVDVGIVRAHFGVAETAAVWLTESSLVVQALGFLSQHLVILLDPQEIVSDMHAAYEQCHLGEESYGCFMVGPSATADIDGVLVHGAQGARSLTVLFLNSKCRE